ncbi:MAG: YggS family pyridoxal phosphate-dependent enzyme [Candidatus Omnitrophica bacterium]|nr:YggS family pyridoxal phosphate-dependent enzyme [Candidatus Omnitrophota bacterium]
MNIRHNISEVLARIDKAAKKAGRDPEAVKLIVVTKEASEGEIREAISSGQLELGENRVNEALLKQKTIKNARWHMIGHLQTRKAKDAVRIFTLIHSVDSIKLAEKIDAESTKRDKKQDLLIEVNTSGEKNKFGIAPAELEDFIKETARLKSIKIKGLMTMAPFSGNAEDSRVFFRKLRELADKNNLKELSMGMTQDFEVAVAEGATMVRIGSAIFKE